MGSGQSHFTVCVCMDICTYVCTRVRTHSLSLSIYIYVIFKVMLVQYHSMLKTSFYNFWTF
jgi:hypothetical protein